jgi:hypothetical protein
VGRLQEIGLNPTLIKNRFNSAMLRKMQNLKLISLSNKGPVWFVHICAKLAWPGYPIETCPPTQNLFSKFKSKQERPLKAQAFLATAPIPTYFTLLNDVECETCQQLRYEHRNPK